MVGTTNVSEPADSRLISPLDSAAEARSKRVKLVGPLCWVTEPAVRSVVMLRVSVQRLRVSGPAGSGSGLVQSSMYGIGRSNVNVVPPTFGAAPTTGDFGPPSNEASSDSVGVLTDTAARGESAAESIAFCTAGSSAGAAGRSLAEASPEALRSTDWVSCWAWSGEISLSRWACWMLSISRSALRADSFCRARLAASPPSVWAMLKADLNPASAFFCVPSNPVMSLNRSLRASTFIAADKPSGSGRLAGCWMLTIAAGSGVGVRSGSSLARLAVDSAPMSGGVSVIADSSHRQKRVSSIRSQASHSPLTASA